MAGGAKAYNGNNGWAIGAEIDNGTVEFQNEVDASSLYQLLENQIIPLYYAKPDGKLPLAWLQLMRESIRSVTPVFNTHRMVKEYTERLYIPAAKSHEDFSRDDCAAADAIEPMENADAQRIGRRCGFTMSQVGNQDRQNIPVGESLQLQRASSSRRRRSASMCAWKLITAKPRTAASRIPPSPS